MQYNHPLFPMSCNLRTVTAKAGKKTTSEYTKVKPKKIRLTSSWLIAIASPNNIDDTIQLKRKKNQYSLLEARPLKVTYFLKHVFTAHKRPFPSVATMGDVKEPNIGFSLVKLGESVEVNPESWTQLKGSNET